MAVNQILPSANIFPVVAPVGGMTAGQGYVVEGIFGVCLSTVAAAAWTALQVDEGAFEMSVVAAAYPVAAGKRLYWDDTNKECVVSPSAGMLLVGHAVVPEGYTPPTNKVGLRLMPSPLSEPAAS